MFFKDLQMFTIVLSNCVSINAYTQRIHNLLCTFCKLAPLNQRELKKNLVSFGITSFNFPFFEEFAKNFVEWFLFLWQKKERGKIKLSFLRCTQRDARQTNRTTLDIVITCLYRPIGIGHRTHSYLSSRWTRPMFFRRNLSPKQTKTNKDESEPKKKHYPGDISCCIVFKKIIWSWPLERLKVHGSPST